MARENPFTAEVAAKMDELHQACGTAQVSYDLCYEESADTWYFAIRSSAPAEKFVGKSRSMLIHAVDDALQHATRLFKR